MMILRNIVHIAEILVFISLAASSLYLLVFGIAGVFRYRQAPGGSVHLRKFAILVPGYKEDNVIVETALGSLRLDYPQELYDVYIIADSFRPDTLERLRELQVRVIEVSFDKSTKAKALNRAMAEITIPYDGVVVLDADNLMAPDFLREVNDAMARGYSAIQGHRTAKNTDTPFALLDAISEEINNHIFRKGHRVLGVSSALIGSGMAFDYGLYKDFMTRVSAHGEDKELEMQFLGRGITIEYLPEALVYDEKTRKAEVFAKQRKRWLSAQFEMFREYGWSGVKQMVTRGNIDLFNKVVQMILPPRVLQLGLVTLLLALAVLLHLIPATREWIVPDPALYLGLWIATAAAILLSIPRRYYTFDTLKALKSVPYAFVVMFGVLFRLRGAGSHFIHTPHGTGDPGKR